MKRFLALLAVGFLYAPRAWAQGYVNSPINLKAQKLPPFFLGHNPVEVYNSLGSTKTAKGRFETTSQYQARRARVTSHALFGKTYAWSPLGFVITPSWSDYNADTREFVAHFALYKDTVYEDFSGFDINKSHEVLRTVTQSYLESSRTYEAQNAFGAHVTVDSEHRSAFGFTVMNWKDFKFVPTDSEKSVYRLSYKTYISPDAARKLQKNIRAMFVGYSTTPYQTQDIDGKSATYDSPYSRYTQFYYACLHLKEVWFFDEGSGYIFQKSAPIRLGNRVISSPVSSINPTTGSPVALQASYPIGRSTRVHLRQVTA